jgi:hypothetical protein
MTKAQVQVILDRIDVRSYPLLKARPEVAAIYLEADEGMVKVRLRTPDAHGPGPGDPDGFCPEYHFHTAPVKGPDDHPEGFCPGLYSFHEVHMNFEKASVKAVLVAAEAAIFKALRHELHEHMKFDGQLVFEPHPEAPFEGGRRSSEAARA